MKQKFFQKIAYLNRLIFPSFGKRNLELSNAKKWQLAIIGYRAYITKNAINN